MGAIAFQGEVGAYSEAAAIRYFGPRSDCIPCRTFSDAFKNVESGKCSHAVVPIENALAGSVHENYDLLLRHDLTIVGEVYLRIEHCLLAMPEVDIIEIRKVYSHPQALQQCREYLERYHEIEPVPCYDTAGSARLIAEQKSTDAAAIASEQASRDYGLSILARGIESNRQNYTRFIVLSAEPEPISGTAKTSIVFALKDIPGALFKSLSVFALRDINLLKIESRPIHGEPWKYLFYLDFEGDAESEPGTKAVSHLGEITTFLRVLGTYSTASDE